MFNINYRRSTGRLSGSALLAIAASLLSNTGFKTPAARITDKATVEALVTPLRQLADAQGASLSNVEVLGWGAGGTDKTLTETQAQAVIADMKSSLQTAGFRYALPRAATRSEQGTTVTLMTAINPTTNQRLVGFWIRTGNALLLAWGQVETASQDYQTTGHDLPQSYNPHMVARFIPNTVTSRA